MVHNTGAHDSTRSCTTRNVAELSSTSLLSGGLSDGSTSASGVVLSIVVFHDFRDVLFELSESL